MQNQDNPGRSRWRWVSATACVVLTGLASRSSAAKLLPSILTDYAGDTLWALMVYCLFATLSPRSSPRKIAVASLMFATTIEVSQLFKPAWLEFIRNLPGMRLVFGYGFLWSDLVCYCAGVLIGWWADARWSMRRRAMHRLEAD